MCKLGLTDGRQNDSHTHTVFQCLLSLLLPVGDIMLAFDEVSFMFDDQSPSKTLMQHLLRYTSQQWLNKSTIGPSRLSVRDCPARTNNAVESFHAALRRRIKVSHPNLFAFLEHLQQAAVDSQADVNQVSRQKARQSHQ